MSTGGQLKGARGISFFSWLHLIVGGIWNLEDLKFEYI
jgi:hypothetical protein